MITISLCMIVKNEENVICRCLNSVKDIVDEIIIVDTGSFDKTKELVKSYTNKIYDFKWIYDFSAARNFSFERATKEYILWLDADDEILEEDRMKFLKLKETMMPDIDEVMMKYNVGLNQRGEVTLSYYRERLSKRSRGYKWHEPVHEYLEISGKVINSDICVTHKKDKENEKERNLLIYKKHLSEGKKLTTRGTYYYARELYYNKYYREAIESYNKFLASNEGWLEDNINACLDLAKCYSILNDKKNSLRILYRSFEYDTPRAEACCNIGYYYFEKNDYKRAIFWYELATRLEKPASGWGFIYNDYWDYIPYMQLCVCYDRLGKIEDAIKYNDKAAECKPNDPSVVYNKKYFSSIQS
ncbi:glycosyltransferase [Clostridium sp. 'White wine YQ']|uniref:glycosyltransferase n=1 Tax=Clostridium sp. 'White wine YQ' TaxID=3027474 RepID=UPI0023671C17|nr:glycosyltransferase [Clostridium sp. 'White wine YQ']MDD7793623.1 glycosyltransferase [Clostridium sp. 'White wine YQ']